jgi:TolB-like protein/cytochrome c-type biogenesis protein CcmH/NrfG
MEIIAAIINKEPKTINSQEVPPEIEKIISKTLRKDRNERYQTIKGLLADLKEVKQELEFQDKLEKTVSPDKKEPKTQMLKATTVDEQKQTTTANDSIAIKKSSFNKIAVGMLAILLISAIGFGYWYFSSGNQINSIAVMPFVNESGDEDVEYLSDGMTETLISSLSNIPNLSVKARSTVFYYKDKNKSAKEIGEELKVDAVLLGRINQKGEGLKISLELVDVESLDAVWSQSYDRKMSDLVSLQSEIARNVSENLQLKLSAADEEKVTKTNTTNAEAQQLYLKGRFHWNKRESENLEKAEQYFKQAIEKDPNYALAYSGLADSYALLPIYGDFRPKEYFPRAKQAAQKALALDDNLAEAHTSLANVIQTYEYDWASAEKEYKRALELNPNYASARHWYGEHLSTKGDHDRAIEEFATALKLDPFSRVINRNLGFTLYAAGKYDEAIVQLKKSIELFPDDSWGYLFLGDTYAAKGNYDLAVTELVASFKIDGKTTETINKYKDAYKKDGWKGFWSAQINDQLAERAATLEKNPSAYIQNWRIAQNYATIGNKDKAIEYLKTAIDEREPDIIYISNIHYFDPMRDDPRFVELMKKVGFPQIK